MGSKNVVDRFNRLPEEIRSHILSLMPTKSVVQTSILSKRWKYSWRLITKLDLVDADYPHHLDSLLKFVDRVFKFCKTSQLKLFRLHFYCLVVPKSRLSKWINEAVRLNICEFDIYVKLFDFPSSMFTCKTLTSLQLHRSDCDYTIWEFPCSVNLPCLKTLDVSVYSNPFANAFKLVRGCPMLESLSLEIRWFDDGQDYIFNIPTLRRLKLTLLKCASTANVIVLNVPNLEYLFIGGVLCSFYVTKDVSSLVEASHSVTEIRSDHLWVELLRGLSGVEALSIANWFSASPLPMFPNMKNLKLEYYDLYDLVVQFLENSSKLEHLCIVEPEASSWIEPESVPACMLTNLTTLEFSTYCEERRGLQFLEYMLGNAEILKTLTITCHELVDDENLPFCGELLELPRASRYCRVKFYT